MKLFVNLYEVYELVKSNVENYESEELSTTPPRLTMNFTAEVYQDYDQNEEVPQNTR